MPGLLLLILLAAFEQDLPFGASGGMTAGTAHPEWRNAIFHNPALAVESPCRAFGAGYWQPYGLAGVNHLGLAGVLAGKRWAGAVSIGQLGFERYAERDLAVTGAYRLTAAMAFGAGAHLLMLSNPIREEAVIGLDAGISYDFGKMRIAAAVNRFNRPRFSSGEELPPTIRVGAAAEPLQELAVAIDYNRFGTDNELALGAEMRLLPELAVRCGGRYPPLGYSAGIGVNVGPLAVDYSYRYNARLRDSHIFGIGLSCW